MQIIIIFVMAGQRKNVFVCSLSFFFPFFILNTWRYDKVIKLNYSA